MIILGNVGFGAAFLAGLAIFFSPCTLPLIPAWLATFTGREYGEIFAKEARPSFHTRFQVFESTLFFVLGFGILFTLMGAAASAIGDFLFLHRDIFRYIGAVVLFIMGLILLGILQPKKLLQERRLNLPMVTANPIGAFLVGIAFAAGWTPCGGPLLGSMLSLAAFEESVIRGSMLLACFSGGIALPFLILSLFLNKLYPFLKKLGSFSFWFSRVLGVLVVALAILLLLDKINLITPDVK
ncbi:MAG: cytochrome c biogenesis protein CcdA [Deltaproteobacteria bacterium]|jgi:cytochrome c-type biogenesis protein|nr:cytochrome c biogenesis protein CcdA [Deltaproteobacteria bacterium]